jgi:hypothetical protein
MILADFYTILVQIGRYEPPEVSVLLFDEENRAVHATRDVTRLLDNRIEQWVEINLPGHRQECYASQPQMSLPVERSLL